MLTQTQTTDSPQDQAETLGQPMPHVEVKIADLVTGEPVGVGEEGEICARGYQNMVGYWDMPDATAATIDGEGWLHTGDAGTMDGRGYLRIAGRLKDIIIRGGENIHPLEIEQLLADHPGVAEVAVIGVPDPHWGEQVAAVIRPADAGRAARPGRAGRVLPGAPGPVQDPEAVVLRGLVPDDAVREDPQVRGPPAVRRTSGDGEPGDGEPDVDRSTCAVTAGRCTVTACQTATARWRPPASRPARSRTGSPPPWAPRPAAVRAARGRLLQPDLPGQRRGGERWVLRRPPLGHVLATAHDMDREGGIMAALAGTGVPVPAVLGRTADPRWNGAPFFVMSYVPGQVLRTPADTAGLAADDLAAIAYGLFDVLAAIHAVDLAATGLDRAGPQRLLRRAPAPPLAPAVAGHPHPRPAADGRAVRRAERPRPGAVRGDADPRGLPARQRHPRARPCRSARCSTGSWPPSGDPLADLGLALAYWTEPHEAGQLPPAPTDTPGFPARREVAARYLERSGRAGGDLSFYVALAHWKIACMAEGVYTRHRSGDMGASGADMDLLRRQPGMRARAARRVLDGRSSRAGGDRMTDTVRFEVSGPVATITLNRPDRLNAMTEELIGGVLARLEQASADDAIRVVVLTGAGRGFLRGR